MRGLKSVVNWYPFFVSMSHPSRVRGLKFKAGLREHHKLKVASFTGAWIEMILVAFIFFISISRILHGCVD